MAFIRRFMTAKAALAAVSASIAVRNQAPSPFAKTCRRRPVLRQKRPKDGTPKTRRSTMRHLCKGNVAIVKGAVLAGCRSYYGYPITPASEIAEYAALY